MPTRFRFRFAESKSPIESKSILPAIPLSPVFKSLAYCLMNSRLFALSAAGASGSRLEPAIPWIKRTAMMATAAFLVYILVSPVITREINTRRAFAVETAALLDSARTMFPACTSLRKKGSWTCHEQTLPYCEVYTNDSLLGYVIASCATGYGGSINVLVGVTLENTVCSVRILSHNETPNLGSKIADADFLSQLVGKYSNQLKVTTDAQAGCVQAITAATISSRAVSEDAVAGAVSFIESLRK